MSLVAKLAGAQSMRQMVTSIFFLFTGNGICRFNVTQMVFHLMV